MKIKPIIAIVAAQFLLAWVSASRAADITAAGSGDWFSTVTNAPWPNGIVPSTNDSVDIEVPYTVTVNANSNAVCGFIYGTGALTLGTNSTLDVYGDNAGAYEIEQSIQLDATAAGCTVNYRGNAFWANRTDYYNLGFLNATSNHYDFYNGPTSGIGAVPMRVAGDMTVVGYVKVQQGADFAVDGNLWLGTNSTWDSSSFNLTVSSNTLVDGLLLDLDGALGTNTFRGSLTVSSLAIGWNVSDVITWSLGGNLTNDGTIVGRGYGSISFDGTGIIAGTKSIRIPTMTVNGTYTIADTITLITNTPTLNGTLVFDLANTNQIVLLTNAGTALYYSGNLEVINSGPQPAPGASYKLFDAPSYGGAFSGTSYPSLSDGLYWVDNLLTTGSLDVGGVIAEPPTLAISRNGLTLTLSWDSTSYPGYSVQAQTNSSGLGPDWAETGSGTVSPFIITLDPGNPPVFFRLYKP